MDMRLIELAKLMAATDWEEETVAENSDFILTQFEGTVFSSDYKCVKVSTKGNLLITEDGVIPQTFVAKNTTDTERQSLLWLRAQSISVPRIYGAVSHRRGTIIFEELISGREIYKDMNTLHWVSLAKEVAKIHALVAPFPSVKTYERVKRAVEVCQGDEQLRGVVRRAVACINNCPPVLVHGDLFPTNVLVRDDGSIVIIDWADIGNATYINDLGRLTGLIDANTMEPFCPCEDTFREAYYECVKEKMDYREFLEEFYLGQFIEVAAYYEPNLVRSPFANQREKAFTVAIRKRLLQIASRLK